MLPKAAPSNVEGSAAVNTGIHVSDPANEIEHILQNQEDYYRVLKVGPGLIAMLWKLYSLHYLTVLVLDVLFHQSSEYTARGTTYFTHTMFSSTEYRFITVHYKVT